MIICAKIIIRLSPACSKNRSNSHPSRSSSLVPSRCSHPGKYQGRLLLKSFQPSVRTDLSHRDTKPLDRWHIVELFSVDRYVKAENSKNGIRIPNAKREQNLVRPSLRLTVLKSVTLHGTSLYLAPHDTTAALSAGWANTARCYIRVFTQYVGSGC